MTAAEKLRQEGRREGHLEGEVSLLMRQLVRRFGTVSLDARRKIESGSETELERWGEQVLDAKTLDDVFR